MNWIKITDVGGPDYINLSQLYRIVGNPSTFQLTFYDANSILPITYTFSNLADYNTFVNKIERVAAIIDIDSLAPQG